MTDYRARILDALHEAWGITALDMQPRYDQAADAVVEILRDLTRDLSEEVARLRLADADRASRELLGAAHHRQEAEERLEASDWQWQQAAERGTEPTGAIHEAAAAQVHATLALTDVLQPIAAWVEQLARPLRAVDPARPAPDAASTPAPVPASDDAQREGDEAHSGSQGADGGEA